MSFCERVYGSGKGERKRRLEFYGRGVRTESKTERKREGHEMNRSSTHSKFRKCITPMSSGGQGHQRARHAAGVHTHTPPY